MAQHAQRGANLATEALAQFAQQMEQWDEDVRDLLGRDTAFAFTPMLKREEYEGAIRELDGPMPPVDFSADMHATVEAVTVRRHEIYRFLTDLPKERLDTLQRYMRLRIVCGDDPVPDPNAKVAHGGYEWNYAVSKDLFDRGLAERDIIHIAEQIAVKFHERMTAQLGRKRNVA